MNCKTLYEYVTLENKICIEAVNPIQCWCLRPHRAANMEQCRSCSFSALINSFDKHNVNPHWSYPSHFILTVKNNVLRIKDVSET